MGWTRNGCSGLLPQVHEQWIFESKLGVMDGGLLCAYEEIVSQGLQDCHLAELRPRKKYAPG